MPIISKTPNDRQVGGDHYRKCELQPWDVISHWGLDFFEGNVLKYVQRWRHKDGIRDLYKARHYLDKLIELNERDSGTS